MNEEGAAGGVEGSMGAAEGTLLLGAGRDVVDVDEVGG